jgi:hypothetical protein
MSLSKGIAGSIIGAAVGSIVWVGLSAASGWGLGLMGIVVGGLAGFGMGQGVQGRGGLHAGIGAAAVALMAVLGARFAVTQMEMSRFMEEGSRVSEEDAVDALATQEFERLRAAGDEFEDWDPENEDWPEIVRYRSELAWSQMSQLDRDAMISEMEAEGRAEMEDAAPIAGIAAFLFSTLRPSGLLLLGLAMSTAYKIGSTDMRAQAGAAGMGMEMPAQAKPGMTSEERAGGWFAMPIREPAEVEPPSLEEMRRRRAEAAAAAEAKAKRGPETDAA